MPDTVRFPFKLDTAFFTTVSCKRSPSVPSELHTDFKVSLKIVDVNFPKLEIFLKLEAVGDQPVTFEVELVGIFLPLESQPAPDRSIIADFINEQALFMLWPYLTQMTIQVTSQMGMNPIRIPAPSHYSFRVEVPPEVPPDETE